MTPPTNRHGQPIGRPVPNWHPRPHPGKVTLTGRFCRLEPLDPSRHADALFDAYATAHDDRDWTYMPFGPFADPAAYRTHAEALAQTSDPLQFTVIDAATQRPVGTLALMRQDAANGVVEVGFVTFSPLLQRRPAATEAQFLLMAYVFETLGYRRYEWKCDDLNAPSRKAALRLGFTFEGTFRNAVVYKGRSRDTAWFGMTEADWPARKAAFTRWLAPENFDTAGQQRAPLAVYQP